jgi:hypothetical protein
MNYKPRFYLCTGKVVPVEDAWKYPEAHILGSVRNIVLEERLVPALALWLEPVDCLHVPPIHPTITALIIGEAELIRCRFPGCFNSVRWLTSRELLQALLARWELPELEKLQE